MSEDLHENGGSTGSTSTRGESTPATLTMPAFTPRAFELLVGLHVLPTKTYYQAHQAEFKAEVEKPFQACFLAAGKRLPLEMKARLETERNLFSRILKNDYGQGGAWDHYWGAFYPKGGRRIAGLQLLASLNHEGLLCGFYIGESGDDQRERLRRNSARESVLAGSLPATINDEGAARLAVYLRAPGSTGYFLEWARLSDDQLAVRPAGQLTGWIAGNLSQLFPLALMALLDDPPDRPSAPS
jgi:5-methylcytosine-specific restriction enzyme B